VINTSLISLYLEDLIALERHNFQQRKFAKVHLNVVLSFFFHLFNIYYYKLLSSSFSFAKMVKEERKLRSKLDLEFPP
jgi:hypothetical protein